METKISIGNMDTKMLAKITKSARSFYPLDMMHVDDFLKGYHFAALLLHSALQGNGEYILSQDVLNQYLREDVARELKDEEITNEILKAVEGTGIKVKYVAPPNNTYLFPKRGKWRFSWYEEDKQ